jgi:hypothetical protein
MSPLFELAHQSNQKTLRSNRVACQIIEKETPIIDRPVFKLKLFIPRPL